MTLPIGYSRAVRLLNDSGVAYTIHDAGADRVPDVPEHSPFPVVSLVKTLALRIEQSWVLVALRANDRLDYRQLADVCGVGRSDITIPPPVLVEADLGMDVGGVSPIPPSDQVRVLFDANLSGQRVVYCGIGMAGKTLEIDLQDLLRITEGQVVSVVRPDTRD